MCEREVLQLIAEEMPNKKIAGILFIREMEITDLPF
jgi:DNA-binding CsgD family transcriptional regulator